MMAVVLFVGVPAFFTLYKKPTCSDNKQNGTERGVDCGGSCARLCPFDFAAPRTLWSYSMRIVPGVYNLMAYVQNPNQNAEAGAVPYIFKLYDDEGIIVAERSGTAFIPAGQKFAIFEGGIQTGQRIPFKTTFEFKADPVWVPGVALSKIRVLTIDLTQEGKPKAEVRIRNDELSRGYSNVDAFIVLYDADDNRVAFSKTTIDSLGANETQTLYFTWPGSFERTIVRTEVLFVARPN